MKKSILMFSLLLCLIVTAISCSSKLSSAPSSEISPSSETSQSTMESPTNTIEKSDAAIKFAEPSKIIVYANSNSKEIIFSDSDFKKILDLTNNRAKTQELFILNDIVSNDSVNNLKKNDGNLSMEFIYDKGQDMVINNETITFVKLFFMLKDAGNKTDKSSIVNSVYHSNPTGYQSGSVGSLQYSKELVDLVASKK